MIHVDNQLDCNIKAEYISCQQKTEAKCIYSTILHTEMTDSRIYAKKDVPLSSEAREGKHVIIYHRLEITKMSR